MSKLNRLTLKQLITDFINRNPPFDTFPLIQKLEDEQVRLDVADSIITRTAQAVSISPTTSEVEVDFTNAEQVVINTVGSIQSAFNVTIDGLLTSQNQICRILINKKIGDTFDFTNADILPFDIKAYQQGKSFISFFVVFAEPVYEVWLNETMTISDETDSSSSSTFASSNAVKTLKDYTDNLVDGVINDYQNADDNLQSYIEGLITTPVAIADLTPINLGQTVFTSGSFQGANKPTLRKYFDGSIRISGTVTMAQNHDFNGTEYFFVPFAFNTDRDIIFTLGVFQQGDGNSADNNVNIRFQSTGGVRIESNGTVNSGRSISFDLYYRALNT